MSADPFPAHPEPAGREPFAELLAAVRAAIAEELAAASVPQLLDGVQARKYVGLSRSGWFRALSAGRLPKPVFVEGSGERFRRVDLDKFVERLKPRRKRRGSSAPEPEA